MAEFEGLVKLIVAADLDQMMRQYDGKPIGQVIQWGVSEWNDVNGNYWSATMTDQDIGDRVHSRLEWDTKEDAVQYCEILSKVLTKSLEMRGINLLGRISPN